MSQTTDGSKNSKAATRVSLATITVLTIGGALFVLDLAPPSSDQDVTRPVCGFPSTEPSGLDSASVESAESETSHAPAATDRETSGESLVDGEDTASQIMREVARLTRKWAEQGDAAAQASLGDMYRDGSGVLKDDREAARWYLKAAEQGDAAAQVNLGIMYQYGRGVPKDDREAARWYRKAAEQGNAAAQNNLAFMYQYGSGVPKDDREAARWYRKAAEQGFAAAQVTLGSMYHYGSGVPKDDREAVRWYRKATEQGFADAQFNLAVMYWNGEGVPKDDVQAYAWANLAAAQGHESARELREDLSGYMTRAQIAEAQKLSRDLAH